jgi:ribosome-associated protein
MTPEPNSDEVPASTTTPAAALSSESAPSGTAESSKRPAKPHLEHSLKLAKAAVRVIADNRGQIILLLDLSGQTALFDYFVIATGTSRRQLSAMATEVDRTMKAEFKERKLSISGLEESRWVILDYGSIVVHLFDEETREFYDLESLWGDATQVDISDLLAAALTQMTRFQS